MTAVDVVIPAHRKDFPMLRHAVRTALRHVRPLGHVYVVSGEPFPWPGDRVSWIPEPSPPQLPRLSDVRERWAAENERTVARASWVYQQLLKLGADCYIDGLSSAYLVIDSDVVFLRAVSFDPEELGRFPYSRAFEYHPPYRHAYERLLGTPPTSGFSLTAHHLLYDRELVSELRSEIETRHAKPWHEAYLDAVDKDELSSISEMDIYGWWVLERHPDVAALRQLTWRDVKVIPGILGRATLAADYHFVAAHAWAREGRAKRLGECAARIAAELGAVVRGRFGPGRASS